MQCRLLLLLECNPENERDLRRWECASLLAPGAGLKQGSMEVGLAGEKDQGSVWCTIMSLLCCSGAPCVTCTLSRIGVIALSYRFAINRADYSRCDINRLNVPGSEIRANVTDKFLAYN